MIQLHHYEPTANSAKAMIALYEKNIPFESCWVDLHRFEQHEPGFLAINPNGQVPVLVVDGRTIIESTVIMEYIEDAFPGVSLRPSDPFERASMRIWTKLVDEHFCPALTVVSFQMLVRPTAQALSRQELDKYVSRIPLAEQRERWTTIAGDGYSRGHIEESFRKIQGSLAKAEIALAIRQFLAGTTYSLADIAFFSMASIVASQFPAYLNAGDHAHCLAWLARMRARPAVQAALAHSRLDHGKAHDGKLVQM